MFFDAIRAEPKTRGEGFARIKAVHIALGLLADGTKEILGTWIEQTAGAKFSSRAMTELKTRGVVLLVQAPSSQESKPPTNPGRFKRP